MSATTEQRHRNLARANDIRLARAELKRRIASGEITVARVLLDPPPEAENWPIAEPLMAQWRWGRTRTLKLLSRNRITEIKTVGELTERQRQLLARMLGHRAGEGER